MADAAVAEMAIEVLPEAVEAPVTEAEATEVAAPEVEGEAAPAAEVAETEAAAEDKPAEAEPEDDTEAQQEAMKFRQVADRAIAENDFIANQIKNDPVFRKDYLRSLQRAGRKLPPEIAAELVEAAPVAAVLTVEQARVEAKKLRAAGRDDEAIELLTDAKVNAALNPLAQKTDAIDKGIKAENEAREKRQRADAEQQTAQHAYDEMVGLSKTYPSLVGMDAKGQVFFKDKAFHQKVVELSQGMNHNADLHLIAEVALARMGRLGTAPKKVSGTKPPVGVASAPAPTKKASKAPEDGMMAIQLSA